MTLTQAESRQIGWYARLFPLESTRHLGQSTSCDQIEVGPIDINHSHT